MRVPAVEEVIEINQKILKDFPMKKADRHSVMSYAKIIDAVQKANEQTDPYDAAAVLLVELVRAHAFASGNKRTSFFCARNVVNSAGRPFMVKDQELNAKILIKVREGFYTAKDIRHWLETGEIRGF